MSPREHETYPHLGAQGRPVSSFRRVFCEVLAYYYLYSPPALVIGIQNEAASAAEG